MRASLMNYLFFLSSSVSRASRETDFFLLTLQISASTPLDIGSSPPEPETTWLSDAPNLAFAATIEQEVEGDQDE